MSVVVDASVLVAATVDAGPEGAWAEAVVESGSLAAPQIILAEATNVLRRLERTSRVTRLEATSAHRDILRLQIHQFPFEPFADRVWDMRGNFTSYDAWYIALAEGLEVPFATLDRCLSRAPGSSCRFLLPEG